MTPGIANFLLARIADDEAVARDATPGPWFWTAPDTSDFPQGSVSLEADRGEWHTCPYYCRWSGENNVNRGEQGTPGHEHRATEPVVGAWGHDAWGIDVKDGDAEHIARWDPARVLAQCEAKRRIVEAHPQTVDHDKFCAADGEESPCPTLRLLALPYADHPDYDEAWRP